MLLRLRESFSSTASYRTCCFLLILLDSCAFIGLIWYFFLRKSFPVSPEFLIGISIVFLACTGLHAFVATWFGRLQTVRAAAMFYCTVGLFFLVTGLMGSQGKEFSVWPWVIVWIATLGVLLGYAAKELILDKSKAPHE